MSEIDYDLQTQLVIFTAQKKCWKNWLKVEIDLSKYATTKQLSIAVLYIYLRCPK